MINTTKSDLTLGGAELEEVKRLRILGVTLDSNLTFETHLQEVVPKADRSLESVRQAGKLFNCQHVLKSCFNAYFLSSLMYFAPVWMSSAESHLRLLDSIVRSEEGCVRVNFVVWLTEGRSVPCICSKRLITE